MIGVLSEVLLILAAQFWLISSQNLIAYENCDVISCPVDCLPVIPEHEECPTCQCEPGLRCERISCPPNCKMLQKADGCLTCACQPQTFEFFDIRRNMRVFAATAAEAPNSRETCSLPDVRHTDDCMSDTATYMRLAELQNAQLVAQPLLVPFLYEPAQLDELCANYKRAKRCLHSEVERRCRAAHRMLEQTNSILRPVCDALDDSEATASLTQSQYNCVRNVLASHRQAVHCSTTLNRRLERALRGQSGSAKRSQKCTALNHVVGCMEPLLRLYCGLQASRFFTRAFLTAQPVSAPECRVDERLQRFEPLSTDLEAKKADETTEAKTLRSNAILENVDVETGKSRRFLVSSQTKQAGPENVTWEPKILFTSSAASTSSILYTFPNFGSTEQYLSTAVPVKAKIRVLDGDKLAGVLEATANARKLDEKKENFVKESHQRDSPEKSRESFTNTRETERCKPIEFRTQCPNGKAPQIVIRWFKKAGRRVCTSYQYSYCGLEIEKHDMPQKSRDECEENC